MSIDQMASQVAQNLTPVNIGLFLALVITTIMAESTSVKASSLWGLGKSLVLTFIDQLKPQQQQASASNNNQTTATQDAQAPAATAPKQ